MHLPPISYARYSFFGLCGLSSLSLGVSPDATAADFYWQGLTNTDWNTLSNWSRDANGLLSITALPTSGDRVLINTNNLPDSLAYDPLLPVGLREINQLSIGTNATDSGFLSIFNGQTLSVANGLTLGDKINGLNDFAKGSLHINNGEALLGYTVYVGNQGSGTLEVENGGKVYLGKKNGNGQGFTTGNLMISYNNNNVALTNPNGTKGSVVVKGTGSELHTSNVSGAGIRVGQGGQGRLEVIDGGLVTTDNIAVGHNTAQATGWMYIGSANGQLSKVVSNNYAYLGGSGTATVEVAKDGEFSIKSLLTLGGNQGNQTNLLLGKGYLTINEGAVRVTDASARTLIGDTTYGEITVQNTGVFESAAIRIAANNAAQGKLIIGGRDSGGTRQAAGTIVGGITFGDNGSKAGQGQLVFNYNDSASYLFSNTIASTSAATNKGEILHEYGANTVILNDNTLFTGNTIIQEGQLRLGNGGSSGFLGGDFTIHTDGTLTIDRNNTVTIDKKIEGSGALVQTGTGSTYIAEDNTNFTGTVHVQNGRLQLGSNVVSGSIKGLLQATQWQIDSGSELAINRSNQVVLDTQLKGGGTLVQQGSGTTVLILNNGTNFTGNVNVSAGVLQLGKSDSSYSNSLQGTSFINNNAELSFQHGVNHTFNSVLQGSGLIRKGQNTTLSLTKDNSSFNGTVVIEEGSIKAQGANSLGQNASYTILANGTLDLNGFTADMTAITNNGHLLLSSTLGTTLTVDTLQQTDTGSLSIALNTNSQPVIEAQSVSLKGGLTVTGFAASNTTPMNASDLANNSFLLIRSQTAIDNQLGSSTIQSLPVTTEDFLTNGRLRLSGDQKNLLLEGLSLAWIHGGTQANRGSFTLQNNSTFNVDVVLSDQSDHGADWDGKALTKKGDGTLILSANNTYTGGTSIEAGTLVIQQDSALGSSAGAVSLGNGSIHIQDTTSSTRSWNLNHALSTIKVSALKNVQLLGSITGAGGLVKEGEGDLALQGTINYVQNTVVKDGTLTFKTDTSALTGDLVNDGTVIFNQALNSSFQGETVHNSNANALAIKRGVGSLSLLNNNTLNWQVEEGTLAVFAQQFLGNVRLDTNTILDLQNTLNTTALFEGKITAHAQSVLEKNGIGGVKYRYDTGSSLGTVEVKQGTFNFQAQGNTINPLVIAGDLITSSGANTVVSGQNTYLDIAGHFQQGTNSTLSIALDLTRSQADIHANQVTLNGTVQVTGFASERGASGWIQKASDLDPIFYTLIRSGTDIQGSFSNNPSIQSNIGYLLYTSGVSADKKSYWIDDLRLAWNNGGTAYGTGTFNVTEDTAFDVDVVLADQTIPIGGFITDNWDGTTLTKKGAGELRLSATHTYTGNTLIENGVLSFGDTNAIENSQSVHMHANAAMDLRNFDQTIHRLSGDGTITLGSAELHIVQDTLTDQNTFQGTISGTGDLRLSGLGSLTLRGDTLYTGTTHLDQGHLILDGIAGGAQLTSNVIGQSGSQLSLINGAQLTGWIDPTDVIIDSTSMWKITGNSLIDQMNISGNIIFSDTSSDNNPHMRLTVKDWVGNGGTVFLRTILEGDQSPTDRIVLTENGHASGDTGLHINYTSGNGAVTGEGILIVDANANGATTTSDAFHLVNRVAAGAFEYQLRYQDSNNSGHNWYLVSGRTGAPSIRGEIAPYSKIADLLQQQGLQVISRYFDRTGAQQAGDSSPPVWGRSAVQFSQSGALGYQSFEEGNARTQAHIALLQFGADWYTKHGQSDSWIIGSYLGINQGRAKVSAVDNYLAQGTIINQGYTFGNYATYLNQDWYIDSQIQFSHYARADLRSSDFVSTNTSAWQWGTSLEAGYRYAISDTVTFIPQVQWIMQSGHIEDFTDTYGKMSFNNHTEQFVRAGMRVRHHALSEDKVQEESAWAELNIWHQLAGQPEMKIVDLHGQAPYLLSGQTKRDWLQISVGGSMTWNKNSSIFLQADLDHSLKGDHYKALTTKVGLRYTW